MSLALWQAQGGGLAVSGGTTTLTTTRIYDNTAPTGANINPTGGILYYALPTVPGSWLPNSDCVANRLPCESWNTACKTAGCSLKAGTSTDSPTPWTPTNCKAPINIQPCDWQTDACAASPPTADCLLGKKIFFVPYFPVDVTFPYPCAAGYLGSNESAYQISSDCAGKCPSGFFCPNASTIEAQPCPPGYYCAEGAAMPLPCPGGTFSNSSNLQSVAECAACPSGSACSVGTLEPSSCLPGSFSAASQASTCDLCPAGKFQRLYGQTVCMACTPGFYCRAGAAEPTPCPAGTVGNATGLYSENQCTYVPAGFWAPLGSNIPKLCPPSGFYCPGALRDTQFGGAEPIIMPIGQSTETQEVQAVT